MAMKKMKRQKQAPVEPDIEHYSCYRGTPMVRISGNFMGGGFNLSKNKAKAILELAKDLKPFANGDMDEDIKSLEDDEIIEP